MKPPQYQEILIRLVDAQVEFIVVGMTGAVIQGVPTMTWDLDVVHRRTAENVERLLFVLENLEAVARHDPLRLKPNKTHLEGPGHILLETRFGDFDCLGAIDENKTYEDLLPHSLEVQLHGHVVRVLHLRELIAIKRRAGRPKDLAVIPYLESTLAETERTKE